MLLGTSINVNDPPSHTDLQRLNMSIVRMVADYSNVELAQYYVRNSIDIALVLTPEGITDDPDQWYNQTRKLIKLWRPSFLIVGNEADAEPSEEGASWIMPQTTFQHLLNVCYAAAIEPWPEYIVGGLVSGQPSYLSNLIIPAYNAVDIHPYAKDDPLPMLLQYKSYLTRSQYLTVGEFNTPADNTKFFLDQLKKAGVYYACWFHYSYGPFALTDAHRAVFEAYV